MRLSTLQFATALLIVASLFMMALPVHAQTAADGSRVTTTSTTDLSPQRAFDMLTSNTTLGVPALNVTT